MSNPECMYKITQKITILLAIVFAYSNIYASITREKYQDYRTQIQNIEIKKMQDFHLQQAKLKIANKQLSYAWGDLAFLLCHIPNHHVAIEHMIKIAPKLNKQTEALNFLRKALTLYPNDTTVQSMYNNFSASWTKNIPTNQP